MQCAGSKGRQFSLEAAQAGGGIFTSAMVAAVADRRDSADIDRNGIIDLGELYAFVRSEVMARSGGNQTPWLARNALVGEMALF